MDVNIGKGLTLSVDAKALPTNALEHVIYIGLRNILMDAHASVTTDEADYEAKARAASEKKLAALMSGEVRVSSGREGDPVKAEAKRIATAMAVPALMKKHGLKKKADVEREMIADAVAKILASEKYGPKIMADAKAAVEARKAVNVDVDELV